MLPNAFFLSKFLFDTAENEPARNLQNFATFFLLILLIEVCRAAGTPFKGSPLEAAEDRSSRHAGAGAGSAAADPMELGQELSPN